MNQQLNAFEQMKDQIESDLKKQQQEVKRNKIEEEKKKKEEQFNQGLEKLADRVIEAEKNKSSNTYVLLKTFLDVALELQGLMKDLNAINDALSCLTDAIGFIDSAITLDSQLLDESMTTKYGLFQRMKNRRKQRKAIKNNVGRMIMLTDSIYMKYNLATDIADAVGKIGIKVKTQMDKTRKKMEKKKLKQGVEINDTVASSRGEEYLKKRREERNATSDFDTSEKPSGGTDQAGSNDISDIL